METVYPKISIEESVLNYYNLIFATAFSKCGDREKAKDYTQDISIKLIEKYRDSDKPVTANLVETMVKNLIIDVWKVEKGRKDIIEKNEVTSQAFFPKVQNIEKDYEHKAVIQQVKSVLTDEQFRVFELLAEGYAPKEIAEMMNLKYYKVKDHLKYGRLKIAMSMIQYS